MKNFFDAKDEKITEKAFSQSLVISVLSILLCIVALCSITYAWFTGSTSSGNNTLVAGSFDVDIVVAKSTDGDTAIASDTEGIALTDGKYILAEPGTYTVTLNPTEGATVKGYCVITLVEGDKIKVERTKVITNSKTATDDYKESAPFTFTIVTASANATVEIEAHWGVPAEPYIDKNGVVQIKEEQSESGDTTVTE